MQTIAHLARDRSWLIRTGASSIIASAILGVNLLECAEYRSSPSHDSGPALIDTTVSALATILPPVAASLAVCGVGMCIAAAIAIAVARSAPERPAKRIRPRESAITPASGGFVAAAGASLVAVIALGAADLLVWSPEAIAPGWSSAHIFATLSPQDRWRGLAAVAIWLYWWLAVSVTFMIAAAVPRTRRRVSASTLATIALAIAAGAIGFHVWAGFGLGMNISDTIPPFVGGMSRFALLYSIAGQACLIAVVFRALGRTPDHDQESAVTMTSHSPNNENPADAARATDDALSS
jgi:MFS family permease